MGFSPWYNLLWGFYAYIVQNCSEDEEKHKIEISFKIKSLLSYFESLNINFDRSPSSKLEKKFSWRISCSNIYNVKIKSILHAIWWRELFSYRRLYCFALLRPRHFMTLLFLDVHAI
jgi:hypothetical protein